MRDLGATTRHLTGTVTGWSGSQDYFRVVECDAYRPELVVDVLRGRLLGVVFRDIIPRDLCQELTSRFLSSPALRVRSGEVPGHYVGAYHYLKTISEYLADAAAVRPALSAILDVPGSPLAMVADGLAGVLADEGVALRLARHGDREACPAVLRSWDGVQEFALEPHEDLGQCIEPGQAGFEIQQAADHQIVAMNLCLENGVGGRLVVWNVKPDRHSRQTLGLDFTGYPYPLEALDGIDTLRLDVRPGDVYFFNGAHVHAVEPNTDPVASRITLSGLLGFVDPDTVVSWT